MQLVREIILESVLEDMAGQIWWKKFVEDLKRKPSKSENQPRPDDREERKRA